MSGLGPSEVHTVTIPVDHSQFTIFDVFGDDHYSDLALPGPDWLVVAGPGGALFHASDRALSAEVTLEIWPCAPGEPPDSAEDCVFHTTNGRVMIACINASPSDKTIPLPEPGDYGLRASRIASHNIAEDGDPDVYQEVWNVKIWPRGRLERKKRPASELPEAGRVHSLRRHQGRSTAPPATV